MMTGPTLTLYQSPAMSQALPPLRNRAGAEVPVTGSSHEHSGNTPRSDRGFAADMREVTQLSGYRENPQSRLHQELYQPQDFKPVPGSPGSRELEVDLGEGIHLTMRVTIEGRNRPIEDLTLEKNGRTRSLLPGDVGINLAAGNSFAWYHHAAEWRGPRSRMELLNLFHELGHAESHDNRTPEEKERYTSDYGTVGTPKQTLSERKSVIGEERFAWARALGTMRQLQCEGFDLFSGIARREIMDSIYSQKALGSYYTNRPVDKGDQP